MLILSTQATAFATSCYVLAQGPGTPCVVLDPGAGAANEVGRLVAAHDLRPVAVAATHGHADHLWDASAVSERWGIPFLLGEDDLDRLDDPAGFLGPAMGPGFTALAGTPWRRPDVVQPLTVAGLAGLVPDLEIDLLPAPGHTPGSTIVLARGSVDPASALPAPARRALPSTSAVAFTGDVLFAGSVGRVDLIGGDASAMKSTLLGLQEAIPAEAWVLPGHGPTSTMAWELAQNPYLNARWLASGAF